MSKQPQPYDKLGIFNPANFAGKGINFLDYPVAQGTETFPNGVIFGDGTYQNTAFPGSSGFVKNPMDADLNANGFSITGGDTYSALSVEALDGVFDETTTDGITAKTLNGIISIGTPTGPLYVDTQNNRIGIGVPTPTEDLEIDGNIQLNTGATSKLVFYDTPNDHEHSEIDASGEGTNGGNLKFYTKEDGGVVQQRMIIDNAGNVGIGTDPVNRLQVLSQNRTVSVLDSGVVNYAELGFTSQGNANPAFGYISGYATVLRTGTSRAGLTDRLTINQNGGFSIGGSYGFAGQVLTSNGSGSSPSWQHNNAITIVQATSYPIPSNTNTTITFSTENIDTNGWFSGPSATITPNIAGAYLLTANAIGVNSGNRALININRNGSAVASSDCGPDHFDISVAVHVTLNAGDNISMLIYQNSGSTRTPTIITLGVQLVRAT
jgi:hypothetical protein